MSAYALVAVVVSFIVVAVTDMPLIMGILWNSEQLSKFSSHCCHRCLPPSCQHCYRKGHIPFNFSWPQSWKSWSSSSLKSCRCWQTPFFVNRHPFNQRCLSPTGSATLTLENSDLERVNSGEKETSNVWRSSNRWQIQRVCCLKSDWTQNPCRKETLNNSLLLEMGNALLRRNLNCSVLATLTSAPNYVLCSWLCTRQSQWKWPLIWPTGDIGMKTILLSSLSVRSS